jgi:hypothetical protein
MSGMATILSQFTSRGVTRVEADSMLKTVFKIVLVVAAIALFVGDPLLGSLAALPEKRKP